METKPITREQMLRIAVHVASADDLIEPLTVAKRTLLAQRFSELSRQSDVVYAPRVVEQWVDDAVSRGVIMAE